MVPSTKLNKEAHIVLTQTCVSASHSLLKLQALLNYRIASVYLEHLSAGEHNLCLDNNARHPGETRQSSPRASNNLHARGKLLPFLRLLDTDVQQLVILVRICVS